MRLSPAPLGAMPWVQRVLEAPDCHLGLGKLCPRSGQRERARQYLTTATTLYREMDMPFWLEQADEEMRGSS